MGLAMLLFFGGALGWFVNYAIVNVGGARLASMVGAGICLVVAGAIIPMLAKEWMLQEISIDEEIWINETADVIFEASLCHRLTHKSLVSILRERPRKK